MIRTYLKWSSLVTFVACSSCALSPAPARLHSEARDTQAHNSVMAPVITGVTFDETTHRRRALGSDNWPLTWSDDDHQYAMWGDGGGFGGSDPKGRASFGVARIEGDHHNYRGVNRYGGKDAECKSTIQGKSHGAPISIGGVLYTWVTPKSDQHGYESFTLHRSIDKGCTWTAREVVFTLSDDGISYGGFVQAGKDSAAARDGYVYTVAPEVTNARSLKIVQQPGRIALVRVKANAIENRDAYQFFAGMNGAGQPIWSSSAADKRPIYEDAAGVGPFPQMSFVPDLDRWVYTNEHGNGVDSASRRSLLTMADAPRPWGPWNVFFKDVFFPSNEQKVFQWNFAPKWFRDEGQSFTLIFSGDDSNDSWNSIDGRFIVQR
jgi:hypothetical protein